LARAICELVAGFGEIQILDFGRFSSPKSGSGNPESGNPDLQIWMSLDVGGWQVVA
jgi:hypothetical protein